MKDRETNYECTERGRYAKDMLDKESAGAWYFHDVEVTLTLHFKNLDEHYPSTPLAAIKNLVGEEIFNYVEDAKMKWKRSPAVGDRPRVIDCNCELI